MSSKNLLRDAIIVALKARPNSNPSAHLQAKLQVTRETVRRHLMALVVDGLITAQGYGKARVYSLSSTTPPEYFVTSTVAELRHLGESQFYTAKIEPLLHKSISEKLSARVAYVATECLNNVIDHSRAEQVSVGIKEGDGQLIINITDNGIGAFASLRAYFHLDDFMEAISELAKGRRTTDPSAHAGEGLFFSSRIADHFSLTSNGISYIYVSEQDDWTITKPDSLDPGTKIEARFKIHSEKTTKSVFDRFTEDFQFTLRSPRLINPYQLALPPGALVSRSEAKKMLAGAESFSSIILDFKLVEMIGQGFAHEVFVVFALKHPELQIDYKNANDFVLKMIRHVTGRR